ncbi:hypothetical protein BGZ60DRAFT_468049 [Tricladium varicosporioides]|nr:hypothetical protein BGZ60DRAFT_468049 [Hymenoscyphus varicosporioides]
MTFLTSLEAIVTFIVQVFVIFPYSALTIQRQKVLINPGGSKREGVETTPLIESHSPRVIMISDKVYKLCTSMETVSTLLANDPTLAPGDAWKQLYGSHVVILATNYWINSVASKYVTDAMKELSRRAGERGKRIIFKLEYDRGSAKQVPEPHYIVSENEYLGKAVALPAKDEIPNLDLQVINYHRPLLGTFHCKYMLVDRKYAILQSNNIQDNDNMEMMTHLEGPIVDSLYDMALISWHKKLEPPLPSHSSPAVHGGLESIRNSSQRESLFQNGMRNRDSAVVLSKNRKSCKSYVYDPQAINRSGVLNGGLDICRSNFLATPSMLEGIIRPADSLQARKNAAGDTTDGIESTGLNGVKSQTESENVYHGFETRDLGKAEILQENTRAVVTSGDFEHIAHKMPDSGGGLCGPDPVSDQFFNSGEQVLPQSQIEHPSSTNSQLLEHTTDDPHYDDDIAGEVARVQSAVSPKEGESRIEAVTRHLNHTKNVGFKGSAPEFALGEEMTPYIPHPTHELFPIAMVCREPYGTPNHSSVYNPQNEVWLSALRNAKKNVFIQSPTLNAEPLVPAIIEACERGIDIYCYTCLGYNDTGELLPMQGGTNEMIAHKLYTSLSPSAKPHLHYFFYTGKDQTVPIIAKKKKRSCHIKVMIVDEHIGIQGNGNQDTQSWYHSQETNVMFDSEEVCRGWIDGLRRNQNTHVYGEVSKNDGIWRDGEGREAEGVIGVDPGRFSWAKGFIGAINRVRGTGDF